MNFLIVLLFWVLLGVVEFIIIYHDELTHTIPKKIYDYIEHLFVCIFISPIVLIMIIYFSIKYIRSHQRNEKR